MHRAGFEDKEGKHDNLNDTRSVNADVSTMFGTCHWRASGHALWPESS